MAKKKLLITTFLYFFLSSFGLSSEQKIVYLNLDYLVQKSEPGKLILEELDNTKRNFIEKFKLQKNNLKIKEENLIKKKNISSKEEFDDQVLALRKEMDLYNKDRQKTFSVFEKNKKEKLDEFLKKITPLIRAFVEENSINIVLNEKNLFIASKKFDITNQIVEIINKTIKK